MKIKSKILTSRSERSGGFTLVEAMVAAVILAILFIAIFGLLNFNIATTRITRENTRATQILLDKMECLRLYQWQQLTDPAFLVTTFTNWTYEPTISTNIAGQGVQYVGNIKITTPIAALTNTLYGPNLAQVTVTISWNSGINNLTHTRSMSTYFSRIGIENTILVN